MPRLFRQQSETPAPTHDPARELVAVGSSRPSNGLTPSTSATQVQVVRRGRAIDGARIGRTESDRGLVAERSAVLARSGNDDGQDLDDELMVATDDELAGDAAPGKVSWGPLLIAGLAIGGALMLMRNR